MIQKKQKKKKKILNIMPFAIYTLGPGSGKLLSTEDIIGTIGKIWVWIGILGCRIVSDFLNFIVLLYCSYVRECTCF